MRDVSMTDEWQRIDQLHRGTTPIKLMTAAGDKRPENIYSVKRKK
jgi:hypothetical protein